MFERHRRRRGETQLPVGERHDQLQRMQEHPVRITVIGIRHVAQDWISRVFQVQTNLVTSSRDWFTPNSRHLDASIDAVERAVPALHDFEARLARFAVFFVHALAKTFRIVVVLA